MTVTNNFITSTATTTTALMRSGESKLEETKRLKKMGEAEVNEIMSDAESEAEEVEESIKEDTSNKQNRSQTNEEESERQVEISNRSETSDTDTISEGKNSNESSSDIETNKREKRNKIKKSRSRSVYAVKLEDCKARVNESINDKKKLQQNIQARQDDAKRMKQLLKLKAKFESQVNNLEERLRKEIELRQKLEKQSKYVNWK
jgi:hypothetical protein